jgi:antitoxin component YwqK of YwqJK toxin-antitoxin module
MKLPLRQFKNRRIMMNMLRYTGAVALLGLTVITFGQGKKTLVEKGIVSITIQEYFLEEGMDKPVVESIEKFNDEGELVEIQEFNRYGEVKKWEQYVYDEEGHLVEERFLDAKGKMEGSEKTIYEDGLKVEKQYFDSKGRLNKKKVYVYGYHR